jgi:hypothetical protein
MMRPLLHYVGFIVTLSLLGGSNGFVRPSGGVLSRSVILPSSRDTLRLVSSSSSSDPSGETQNGTFWSRIASLFSQTAAEKSSTSYSEVLSGADRRRVQLITLIRVGIPSVVAGVVSTYLFPAFALGLATLMNDAGVFAVLSQDSSQFVQNFLTVSGLLFSILVGQTVRFGQLHSSFCCLSVVSHIPFLATVLLHVPATGGSLLCSIQ